MMKYKILSTKKLEPSLIKQAKQNNIDITEQEFISIKTIFSEKVLKQILELAASGKREIIFTSANAVHAFDHYMRAGNAHSIINWKIFCLAGRTKEAVINAGYLENNIVATTKNASSLAKKVIEHKIEEIIFFTGNKRRNELPSLLKEAGIKIHEFVIYETTEVPKIALDDFNAILFFSPSAVKSFFSVNEIKSNTVCFAVGQTTADCISGFTSNKIITSEFPSQEMMLSSVNSYLQEINCNK